MKTTISLLLTSVVALSFALTAGAGETFLSPRANALRNDFRKVPASGDSPNLVLNVYPGAAAKLERSSARVAPTGGVTPNLVSGHYPGAATKNPLAGAARFEIAPLVAVAKTCDMACCLKN